jgi:hypothetical protein
MVLNKSIAYENTFNQAFSLTLDAASYLSPRAAIGWCLLDNEHQVIAYDATMAGFAADKLIRCIKKYSDRCQQLLLTLEPAQGIINAQDLIQALDNSLCQEVNIAYRMDSQLLDPDWLDWKKNWWGKIDYLSQTYIAGQLAAGIESIKHHRRPWVVAVCSADWSGRSLSLNDVCSGFAVREQLIHYASQSRAVLFAGDQRAFVECLPENNGVNEPITPVEIYNNSNIPSLLNYWASEDRCSCVVYSNVEVLSYLLAQSLVDEIIYYLADATGTGEPEKSTTRQTDGINFKGWETTSCSKAGDGCRLVLRRKTINSVKNLDSRFN